MGFLIQAWNVQTPDDLKELGKNVVFDAFARVIPGVGTCKIMFDIGRGVVVVTVGYTFNQLNADLIDALYTGRAGRVNQGVEGKVAGELRDAVEAVLPETVVLRATDDAGKVSITVDQGGVYRHFFTKWSGARTKYYEVESRELIAGPGGRFVQSHDRLVRALQDAQNRDESGWFGQQTTRYKFDDKSLEEAMRAFAVEVRTLARPVTDKVISEMATRQFWSKGQDVIAEGLQQRLVNDVMASVMETWQTHRAEDLLARREVEYMSSLADVGTMALAIDRHRAGGEPMPEFELEVGANHDDLTAVFDGNEPIPFTCVLKSNRPAPSDVPDCVFEIKEDPYELPPDVKTPKPGTIVKQKVTIRAVLANGTVLAEKTLQIKVRLPDDLLAELKSANWIKFDTTMPNVHVVSEDFYDKRGKITWNGNQFTCTYDRQSEYDFKKVHYAEKQHVVFTGTVNSARKTVDIVLDSDYFQSKRRKELEALEGQPHKYGDVMHTISTQTLSHVESRAMPMGVRNVDAKSVFVEFTLSAAKAATANQASATFTTIEKDNDKQKKNVVKGSFGGSDNRLSVYYVRLVFVTRPQQ